jgi:uncharacterized membrane protein
MKDKIKKFLDFFNQFLDILIWVTLGMSTAYMSVTDISSAIAMWTFFALVGIAGIVLVTLYKKRKKRDIHPTNTDSSTSEVASQ